MKALIFLFSIICLFSCQRDNHSLKVIASPIPHAEMLRHIQGEMKKYGIDLEIITVEDYQIPNRALVDHDADANFFQHTLFLENQIAQFHYPLEIAGYIHIEPMGAYSKKITDISKLQDNAIIALPSDPSNEERALRLLEAHHLITVKKGYPYTTYNISSNPKGLVFHEVDAAMIPHLLSDVDLALIPTNFAIQAGFSPMKDALFIENENPLYSNVLVVREGDASREDIQLLVKALKSEDMKKFVQEKYKGAIIISSIPDEHS